MTSRFENTDSRATEMPIDLSLDPYTFADRGAFKTIAKESSEGLATPRPAGESCDPLPAPEAKN